MVILIGATSPWKLIIIPAHLGLARAYRVQPWYPVHTLSACSCTACLHACMPASEESRLSMRTTTKVHLIASPCVLILSGFHSPISQPRAIIHTLGPPIAATCAIVHGADSTLGAKVHPVHGAELRLSPRLLQQTSYLQAVFSRKSTPDAQELLLDQHG